MRELTDALTIEKDQHRDTAIALAQAETREMGTVAEVEQLKAAIAQMQEDLQHARRSWWQKLLGV